METHKVIEVNVDNVIPFRKPKSDLTSKQENLINETLLVLNEKLTRINKCSVRELKDCFYEDDENRWDTDVFEDFYIGDEKDKDQMKCWFGYKIENRKLYKNIDFDKKYFGKKEVSLIVKYLRPTFEFHLSPEARAMQKDEEIKQFTEKQFHIIDTFIFRNKKTLLTGSAGTGKTLIAIETARRLASEGKKVLFVCYNELFGKWLFKVFCNEKNITFERINKLMMFYAGKAKSRFYGDVNLAFETLPKEAIESLDKSPIKEQDKYDCLIIDEVQDFLKEEYFYFLEKLCKKGFDCNMHLFGDVKEQKVYNNTEDINKILTENFGLEFSYYETKENCRNPENIGSRIESYCKLPHKELYTKFIREGGHRPSIKLYDSESTQETQIKKILEELLKDGFFKDEIQFLAFNQSDADLWWSKIKNISTTKIFKNLARVGRQLDFSVETIRRYKGLDKKIIIILGINDIETKESRTLLYVGVSRALSRVYMLMEKETGEKFVQQLASQIKILEK